MLRSLNRHFVIKRVIQHILLFFIAVSTEGFSQPIQPLKDYVIEVWSADEGLPSNNLRHIAKDSRGFLWISTFNGVVRFDGNKFKTFDTNNIPVITTSAFYSVNPQKDGSMYLSTQSSGVIKYSEGKFEKAFSGNETPSAIQLVYSGNDRTWIASRNAGVYYLDGDRVVKYDIPEFNDQSIMCFTRDAHGNTWISSEGAGVARIEDSGYTLFTTENGLASNIVNALIFHDGYVYAGTEQGLSYFDGKVWKNDQRFKGININDIVADKKSNLWFATGVGLARISHPDTFEFIGEKEGLPSRQVSSIIFDDEGSVWLTTKRGGLAQLKLSSFKNITTTDGLSYQGINVVSEGPDGKIYIGSDNGDVDIVNNGSLGKVSLRTNMENVSVKDIYVEDNGTLWIATYQGLIRKTSTSERLYTEKDGLLSIKTRRITKDKNGVIWLGSRNGGINKFYPDGRIEAIGPAQGLGSDFVFSIDETPDGRMVVGTANGGLDIFDKEGNVHIYHPDSTITGLSIFNVYIENDNRMWLATNVGLYCFENKKFHLLDPSVGFKSETIFDVLEDKSGNLWVTSILGVIKISKEEVLQFVRGEISEIKSSILDDSDGMVSRECTGATRSLITSKGNIWLPTIKGVAILNPDNVIVNNRTPSIYIENVIVDDEPLDQFVCCTQGLSFDIEPGHRNYTIDYTSVSMYSPGKVSFKYMLEGFDDGWIDAGTLRQAKYTNLPYGKYLFKVKAANNDGIWSDESATLNLNIKPYLYETRTFVIFLVIGFIAFTIVLYLLQTSAVQGRNRELTKLNRELDSFAYTVSHDLKAPLTSIQGLLNIARLEKGENAMEYYNKIESSVDKLDRFIRDIIDYSKNARAEIVKEKIGVEQLVKEMVDGLSYLSDKKKIKAELDIDSDLIIRTDKTRFVFILNNLLTNAFRYADLDKEEPFVKVSAHVESNKLKISIVDNGQGIKKEHLSRIFEMFYRANEGSSGSGLGLYIAKESVARLKGKINLESQFGVGTSVFVELPV